MRSYLFILFVLSTACADSQSLTVLSEKLKNAKSDTARINAYNALTEYYLDDKNDSAEFFNELSLELSRTAEKEDNNYDGFYFEGEIQNANKEYNEALIDVERAILIAKKNKNIYNETKAIILKGSILEKAQQDKPALESFKSAYDLSKKSNDKKAIALSAIRLGLYYKDNNQISNSLSYFIEAFPIVEELKDTDSFFRCCINMGSLYERTKDNNKALEYYRKALSSNRTGSDDENAKAICYFKIGRLFLTLNKQDSAEYYLSKTMEIHLKRKDEAGLVFDYSFLASIYTKSGDIKKAEAAYETSMQLAVKLTDSIKISFVYTYKGNMYEERNDLPKALDNYQASLRYITKKMPSETTMMIYKNIAKIYQKEGKYKEALDNYFLFKAWSDSAFNINETKKQTEIKLGFEFNQVQEKMKAEAVAKEMINQSQLENEKRQRYYLIGGLVLVGLFLLFLIRSFRSKQAANTLLEKQKLEIGKQNEVLEDKQMEILNSFHYAKRIQDSLLPSEKYIEKTMKRLKKE